MRSVNDSLSNTIRGERHETRKADGRSGGPSGRQGVKLQSVNGTNVCVSKRNSRGTRWLNVHQQARQPVARSLVRLLACYVRLSLRLHYSQGRKNTANGKNDQNTKQRLFRELDTKSDTSRCEHTRRPATCVNME